MPAAAILMIRPARFGFNAQTAGSNAFQQSTAIPPSQLQQQALQEFDDMVTQLQNHGIEVLVINDTETPPKPDAVFPNNWFATMPGGSLTIFPMQAASRRAEKRDDLLQLLLQRYRTTEVQDWSEYEAEGFFLESTGSMVMDHPNKIIYACLSGRTHPALLERFARQQGYRALPFAALDEQGKPVYHTNVLMCIGEKFAVICTDAISNETERIAVIQLLELTGHEPVCISFAQMNAFAGNMLELKNKAGENMLVMSRRAFDSLTATQKNTLQQYAQLLPVAIPTIETTGGGSARCMMAEIWLEKKEA
jgi:hypothetical protein